MRYLLRDGIDSDDLVPVRRRIARLQRRLKAGPLHTDMNRSGDVVSKRVMDELGIVATVIHIGDDVEVKVAKDGDHCAYAFTTRRREDDPSRRDDMCGATVAKSVVAQWSRILATSDLRYPQPDRNVADDAVETVVLRVNAVLQTHAPHNRVKGIAVILPSHRSRGGVFSSLTEEPILSDAAVLEIMSGIPEFEGISTDRPMRWSLAPVLSRLAYDFDPPPDVEVLRILSELGPASMRAGSVLAKHRRRRGK